MEYRRYPERINELSRDTQTKETKEILDYSISGLVELNRLEKTLKGPEEERSYANHLCRFQFLNIFLNYEGQGGLVLLQETLADSTIVTAWEEFFTTAGITCAAPLTPEAVYEKIMSHLETLKQIPDSLIQRSFSIHIQKMIEQQREFEDNELPAIVSAVDKKINQAIKDGKLPVSRSRWEKIKNSTTVIVRDSIRNVDNTMGNANGTVISISPNSSFEQKVHIAIHEFIHQLDGKLLVKTTTVEAKEGEPVTKEIEYNKARGGLLFEGLFYSPPKRQWLNEAVTEDLAMTIDDQESGDFYPAERRLLETLVQALGPGSRELLQAVYFEQYDVKKIPTERLKQYKKFTQLVSAKLGRNFLNKLEKFLNRQCNEEGDPLGLSESVQIAATTWQELGTGFPDYLEKWSKQEKELTQLALQIIEKIETKQPQAYQVLTIYSSDSAYETIWEQYGKAEVPVPPQFPISRIRNTVLEKLKYKTKRASYRKKFGIN